MRVQNAAERQLVVADEQLTSLEDVVRAMPTAQYLNVSFNNLTSLSGLEQMRALLSLDISHNEVESLQEVADLRKLLVLKCSSNKIADLSWLVGLSGMEELWIRGNRIERAQLAHLQQLTELQTLVIQPNPCTERSDYVLSILKILPWLQRIDTVVITEELRVEARHAEEREALDSGATDCTLFSLSGRAEGTSTESPDTTPREAAPLIPSKSKQQIAEEEFMRSFPVQDFIPVERGGILTSVSSNQVDVENQENALTPHQCEISDNNPATEDAIKAKHETKIEDPIPKPEDENRGTSALLNSILTLPTFGGNGFLQKKKLPQSQLHGRNKSKSRSKASPVSSTTPNSSKTASFQQDEEFSVIYPNSSVTAIQIRRDGSAIARWPAGSVAVSVDFETSSNSSGFRVYAAHKDGQLALSFDPAGVGFLNSYPSGKTMISTTSDGDGLMFDSSSGGILRQWDSQGNIRDGSCQPVDALGDERDGSVLCRLSENLAVRVQLVGPTTTNDDKDPTLPRSNPILLHIYFAGTPGIRHTFENRANRAEASSCDVCDEVFGKTSTKDSVSKAPKAKPPPVDHLDLLSSIRAAVAGL